MIEQELALDRAVVLAANCVGGRDLRNSARDLAILIQRGQAQPGASASDASRALPGIPPLLRWLLLQSKPQQSLQGSLRQAAALYRRRADDMSYALQVMLPVITSVGIGGSVTAVYVLAMFVPVIEMISRMAI
jgi:type II secretory pathway component PulF